MRDGLGRVHSVLVIGGSSEIGSAIADRLLDGGGAALLAGRDPERLATAARRLHRPGRPVSILPYHASYTAVQMAGLLRDAHRRIGDIDVVVLAVGELADESANRWDTAATRRSLVTNLLGPAVAAHAAATDLAAQGHGCLVVLSSAAAARPRDALLAYAAAKRGLDAFARGLDRRLAGTGARVLVVRPGHVLTRMTDGLRPPPLWVSPDDVADAVVRGVARGAAVAWVPRALPAVLAALWLTPRRLLPAGLR